MSSVQYGNDTRYPGPSTHPPPAHIEGIPTQADLDSYPRIFTWGELKGIVRSGDLVHLMRNKELQARYDDWMIGQRDKYGSTEKYLTQARLPWAMPIPTPPDTYILPSPPPSSTSAQPAPPADGPKPLANPLSPTTPSAHLKAPSYRSTPPAPLNAHTLAQSQAQSSSPAAQAQPITPQSARFPPSLAASQTYSPSGPGGAGIGGRSQPGSGASTPSSAGFVSLDSLNLVDGKLRRARSARSGRAPRPSGEGRAVREWEDLSAPGSPTVPPKMRDGFADAPRTRGVGLNGTTNGADSLEVELDDDDCEDDDDQEEEELVYLKYDPEKGLDSDKFAVLPNDWPYNVPYGVRHYCVWCRVPIAHPILVDYYPAAWARIESEGLGGFTGITPLRPYPPPYLSSSPATPPPGFVGTKFFPVLRPEDYYTADVHSGGSDLRTWAGVTYESAGGQEVGRMVRGLWDPRGWETAWFVNPPRLQSVPGFAHFHVFARRKTPTEVDASEKAWEEGWRG